jgi:hypothetical protein
VAGAVKQALSMGALLFVVAVPMQVTVVGSVAVGSHPNAVPLMPAFCAAFWQLA